MQTKDICPGVSIGRWVVVSGPHKEVRRTPKSVNYITVFECRCQCGVVRRVRAAKLTRNSKSCGCARAEQHAARVTRHGFNRAGKRARLYRIWDGMTQRCTNPNHSNYHLYGGAGVGICGEWRDFVKFAAWAIPAGYSDHLEIDRINGAEGYRPDNCRWVTEAVQHRNKRSVHFITAFGETKCVTDWCLDPRCSVGPQTLWRRVSKSDWGPERAIVTPRQSRLHAPRFAGNHVTPSRPT